MAEAPGELRVALRSRAPRPPRALRPAAGGPAAGHGGGPAAGAGGGGARPRPRVCAGPTSRQVVPRRRRPLRERGTPVRGPRPAARRAEALSASACSTSTACTNDAAALAAFTRAEPLFAGYLRLRVRRPPAPRRAALSTSATSTAPSPSTGGPLSCAADSATVPARSLINDDLGHRPHVRGRYDDAAAASSTARSPSGNGGRRRAQRRP